MPGRDETELDDLSPDGYAAPRELARDTLARLDTVEPVDEVDRVTVAAMRERLGSAVEIHEAGYDRMELNVIASPLQGCRDVFDLMPTATQDDWATIATRLTKVPTALEQWTATLRESADRGLVTPAPPGDGVHRASARSSPPPTASSPPSSPGRRPTARRSTPPCAPTCERGVAAAADAYQRLGDDLRTHLLDRAPESDAVGRERYQLASRQFLGATVDLEETYAWGQEELARIEADMARHGRPDRARRLGQGGHRAPRPRPGATCCTAPTRCATGCRPRADEVIADMADTHFDIPGPVRTIECRIAPTQTGGIYYTGPSDDFTRPGRMWWSVPKGVTEFGTWRELTTVYHEGVPGHHLQVAQTVYRRELLNRWRRMMCWVSGHGEGWALYAERLMAELGYMDDPGNYLGLLDGQSLRAARVVLDIGVHCGFEAPAEVGGGDWTYDKAWQFLTAHANQGEELAALRAGPLPRLARARRRATRSASGSGCSCATRCAQREGDAFSLKDFHRRSLDLGWVGLDTLRTAVLG